MHAERFTTHNWLIHKINNDCVRRRLPLVRGDVLDIGCGTRPFENDVLRSADTYLGIDWSSSMHGLHADVIADANQPLPLLNGVFDHVLSFEVLEHLAEPDIMLEEANRVLKSGGWLTLTIPFQWWIHEASWDFQRFTQHGLEHHLRKAGFEEIKVVPKTGFWVMWILKFNYQTTRLIRGPRFMRRVIRALLIPMWFVDQMVAPWLDRMWPDERETAGYFVTAREP